MSIYYQLISHSGFNDDKVFCDEAEFERAHFDKGTGEVVILEPTDKPEGDFFEQVDAGQGEEFMAVKPWIGAVMEPTDRKFGVRKECSKLI